MNDIELLRSYADTGSDSAFAELVNRHLGLVYSAALRQMDGNVPLAEEVTQTVFTDLARKSRRLSHHTSLSGWLYTSTRFVAASLRRAEHRRRARELEVTTMNSDDPSSPDSFWADIRPVLDEAMHDLTKRDREAVLLRYFEDRPLADVGARLGLTENAARMRVNRALEKLREALHKRGLTSTAAALAVSLPGRASAVPPGKLAERIAATALAGAAGSAGWFPAAIELFASAKGAAIFCAAVLLAIVLIPRSFDPLPPEKEEALAVLQTGRIAELPPERLDALQEISRIHSEEAILSDSNLLHLLILNAEDDTPLANVPVEFRGREGNSFDRRELASNHEGLCEIHLSEAMTELQVTTRMEGFADTRLQWRPDRGEKIPSNYTLRLERPLPIGGTVLDYRGNPVPGAKVGFNHESDPAMSRLTENHHFSPIQTTTDEHGRWWINRIGKSMLRLLYGSARDDEHVGTGLVFTSREPRVLQELRNGTHIFQLGEGAIVSGTVLDPDGLPIFEAAIQVGMTRHSGRRETKSQADGTFTLRGCKPGKEMLTASAEGFAPMSEAVELSVTEENRFHITLERGKALRVRVVEAGGEPIAGARVMLDTMGSPASPAGSVQVSFNSRADGDGRVVWHHAPDREMAFSFSARGFMRVDDMVLPPGDQEHTVALHPALAISGTVRDANTGHLLPRFRIISGFPSGTGPKWSTIERFWFDFEGGIFRHNFEEPVVNTGAQANPGFIFKFEAEGYAPFVSRAVALDEGNVELQVELHPAISTSILVMTPMGEPAVEANVGLVSPGTRVVLRPAEVSKAASSGGAVLTTDREGRFRLPADDAIVKIIVAHPEGYREATVEELAMETSIHLKPWGRLEGVCLAGQSPVPDQMLAIHFGGHDRSAIFHNGFEAKTDASGRFLFPTLPPGPIVLVWVIPSPQNQADVNASAPRPQARIEIRPGESASLVVQLQD